MTAEVTFIYSGLRSTRNKRRPKSIIPTATTACGSSEADFFYGAFESAQCILSLSLSLPLSRSLARARARARAHTHTHTHTLSRKSGLTTEEACLPLNTYLPPCSYCASASSALLQQAYSSFEVRSELTSCSPLSFLSLCCTAHARREIGAVVFLVLFLSFLTFFFFLLL